MQNNLLSRGLVNIVNTFMGRLGYIFFTILYISIYGSAQFIEIDYYLSFAMFCSSIVLFGMSMGEARLNTVNKKLSNNDSFFIKYVANKIVIFHSFILLLYVITTFDKSEGFILNCLFVFVVVFIRTTNTMQVTRSRFNDNYRDVRAIGVYYWTAVYGTMALLTVFYKIDLVEILLIHILFLFINRRYVALKIEGSPLKEKIKLKAFFVVARNVYIKALPYFLKAIQVAFVLHGIKIILYDYSGINEVVKQQLPVLFILLAAIIIVNTVLEATIIPFIDKYKKHDLNILIVLSSFFLFICGVSLPFFYKQYFSLFSDTELQGQTLYIMLQMSFVVVCYILRSGYKSKIMHSDNDIFIISDVIPTIFLLSVLYFDIFEFISLLKYPFMIALILDYYLYHYYRKAFSYDIHEDSIIKKLHVMQILLCSSYLVYIEQVLQYEF